MQQNSKAQLERQSARLLHLFSFVPDDKLNWRPAPTAKPAIQIVAHCAIVSDLFAQAITGNLPDPMPSPAEFFASVTSMEETPTSRDEVVALMEKNTALLANAIDSVPDDALGSSPHSPFGPLPMPFWLEMAGAHIAGHAGQLEYLQTIWGDLDNHMS